MRSLFLALILAVLSLGSVAQTQCDFLKNLKFRNGRDTIVVKATLHDFLEAPPRVIRKGRASPAIYKYRFSDDIAFQPGNCSKKYVMPLLHSAAAKYPFTANTQLGITVYLTCVVFDERYLEDDQPDCLVVRVSRTK